MQSRLIVFLIFFLLIESAFCQIENLKWQKVDLSFEKSDRYEKKDYSFESKNAGEFIKKSLINAYWFFISDVDGDNCAFHPSCSSFFMDATEETNIFQGTLMFLDRLTRDLNPIKKNHYPLNENGHYFDPAENYTLNNKNIKYQPINSTVDDE